MATVDPDFSKVQSILSTIDSHNFKAALKQIETEQRKFANSVVLPALKAFVLVRLNRDDEAFEMAETARAKGVGANGTAINCLNASYQALQKTRELVLLCEEVFAKQPTVSDYGEDLFFAYYASGEFGKAQIVAAKLFSSFKVTKYQRWSILSNYLIGLSGAKGPHMMLAERMAAKSVAEIQLTNQPVDSDGNPLPSGDEEFVRLYVDILLKQKKWAAIREFVALPIARLLSLNQEHIRLFADSSMHVGEYALAASVYRTLVVSYARELGDDWPIWRNMLECVVKSSSSNSTSSVPSEITIAGERLKLQPSFASRSDFVDFLRSLCSIRERQPLFRGPVLALMKLQADTAAWTELDETFRVYFQACGTKPCVVSDMRLFADILSSRPSFMDGLVASVYGSSKADVPLLQDVDSLDTCLRKLSVEKLKRLFASSSREASHSVAWDLSRNFVQNYFFMLRFGKDLEKTENQYGDDYLVLAVHYALDAHSQLGNQSSRALLVELVAVLEYGLSIAPKNFAFMLLLLRLYCILSCPSAALDMWRRLEIKNIQCDSLSYLMLEDVLVFADRDVATSILDHGVESFHSEHDAMFVRLLNQHFRYASLSKVSESLIFHDKCVRSAARTLASVTSTLHSVSDPSNTTSELLANLKYLSETESQWSQPLEQAFLAKQSSCLVDGSEASPANVFVSSWDTAALSFFEPENAALRDLQMKMNPSPFEEDLVGNMPLRSVRVDLLPQMLSSRSNLASLLLTLRLITSTLSFASSHVFGSVNVSPSAASAEAQTPLAQWQSSLEAIASEISCPLLPADTLPLVKEMFSLVSHCTSFESKLQAADSSAAALSEVCTTVGDCAESALTLLERRVASWSQTISESNLRGSTLLPLSLELYLVGPIVFLALQSVTDHFFTKKNKSRRPANFGSSAERLAAVMRLAKCTYDTVRSSLAQSAAAVELSNNLTLPVDECPDMKSLTMLWSSVTSKVSKGRSKAGVQIASIIELWSRLSVPNV
jgi:hypothetical protein